MTGTEIRTFAAISDAYPEIIEKLLNISLDIRHFF